MILAVKILLFVLSSISACEILCTSCQPCNVVIWVKPVALLKSLPLLLYYFETDFNVKCETSSVKNCRNGKIIVPYWLICHHVTVSHLF